MRIYVCFCVFDWPVFSAGWPRRYLGSCPCLLGPWKEVVISPGHVARSHSHWIQFCVDRHKHTCIHAQRASFELVHTRTHTHTSPPSPEWPSRRACLCQQMSGRRCVFLCLSLHSFHLLLQRLPICLWPCFISAHSNLSPKRTPVRLFYYRHTGIVYYKKTNPPLLSMQLCWIDTTFKITLLGFDLRS